MKKINLIIIIILFYLKTYGQYTFNCTIEGYTNQQVTLCSQFSDESKIISTISVVRGHFYFSLDTLQPGLYRIYTIEDNYFNFIFNKENITLVTNSNNLIYNMEVIESSENKQLYNYLISSYITDYKIKIIEQFLDIYPDGNFKKLAEKEYADLLNEKNKNIEAAIKLNHKSFAGRYLGLYKELKFPQNLAENEKSKYIDNNFWKLYNINDTLLLNSDAYNQIVINFFKLKSGNLPTTEKYYKSAQEILNKFLNTDKRIFNLVFEYILSGFETLELYDEIVKLSNEYSNICTEDESNLSLRIKNYTELSIGKQVADIQTETITGKTIKLSETTQEYTLLIFWATWCEHCAELIPKIEKTKTYIESQNINILTVSLDKYPENLNNFIETNNLTINIICDYKSWDNQIIKKYFIFGTPTMFIIDKNLKIVARPLNETQLYSVIMKLK